MNETLRSVIAQRANGTTLEERRQAVPSSHLPWTAAEDAELLRVFDTGESADAIAARHNRSVIAIRSRLVKLGRLADWRPPTSVA
jgi:hypothetical protein